MTVGICAGTTAGHGARCCMTPTTPWPLPRRSQRSFLPGSVWGYGFAYPPIFDRLRRRVAAMPGPGRARRTPAGGAAACAGHWGFTFDVMACARVMRGVVLRLRHA